MAKGVEDEGGRGLVVIHWFKSKWAKAVVYFAACFFTSALYYGWQQYANMLFKSGAYEWLCADPNHDFELDGPCEAQDNAVSRLYSIAAGCEYASAALGGVFLDHMGPRVSGLIGEIMWCIGTVLLAYSSQSFQAYIPAMIIIGSSVNVVCFPSLTSINTWPKWQGLMVGMMLAAQSATTGIPVVMYELWRNNPSWTFSWVWMTYVLAIWLPITILYAFSLPSGRELDQILQLQKANLEKSTSQKDEHKYEPARMESGLAIGPDEHARRRVVEDLEEVEQPQELKQLDPSWTDFLSDVLTVDMIVMGSYFCVMMMMYAYYPTVVRRTQGESVSDYLSYIMPFQAVVALFVGLLCDWFRTVWIMMGMCVSLILAFGLSLGSKSAMHYAAATILVATQCAVFEVKYTYVGEMFNPYNFGKLVGFLGVVGGIGTFINIPISSASNTDAVFIGYICTLPVLMSMVMFLAIRQKKGVIYKTIPEYETLSNSATAITNSG